MPTLDMRDTVLTLLVDLTKDSDFDKRIEAVDGTFPDGTEVTLYWGTADGFELADALAVWPATVTPDAAVWSKDKVDVNALIEEAPAAAKLGYKSGEADKIWATGSVVING